MRRRILQLTLVGLVAAATLAGTACAPPLSQEGTFYVAAETSSVLVDGVEQATLASCNSALINAVLEAGGGPLFVDAASDKRVFVKFALDGNPTKEAWMFEDQLHYAAYRQTGGEVPFGSCVTVTALDLDGLGPFQLRLRWFKFAV